MLREVNEAEYSVFMIKTDIDQHVIILYVTPVQHIILYEN